MHRSNQVALTSVKRPEYARRQGNGNDAAETQSPGGLTAGRQLEVRGSNPALDTSLPRPAQASNTVHDTDAVLYRTCMSEWCNQREDQTDATNETLSFG